MKNKKFLRNIAIIISIILIVLNTILYLKMRNSSISFQNSKEKYASLNVMIISITQYFTLIFGIVAVAITWIEYLIINLVIKIREKFQGWKKYILLFITSTIGALLLIVLVYIILMEELLLKL